MGNFDPSHHPLLRAEQEAYTPAAPTQLAAEVVISPDHGPPLSSKLIRKLQAPARRGDPMGNSDPSRAAVLKAQGMLQSNFLQGLLESKYPASQSVDDEHPRPLP